MELKFSPLVVVGSEGEGERGEGDSKIHIGVKWRRRHNGREGRKGEREEGGRRDRSERERQKVKGATNVHPSLHFLPSSAEGRTEGRLTDSLTELGPTRKDKREERRGNQFKTERAGELFSCIISGGEGENCAWKWNLEARR